MKEKTGEKKAQSRLEKQSWLQKLKDYDNKSGLDFVGLEDGVPKWRGGWKKGPPIWFCRMFLAFALTLLTAGILTGLFASGKAAEAQTALLIAGTIHSFVSAIMFRWHRNYQGLLPVEKVSERLGVDAETMRQVAAEKGIKPRAIINEEPFYNLHEFGDVGTLLRGSEAPVSPETLLRAAEPTPSTVPQEQLLRASSAATEDKSRTPQIKAEPQTAQETVQVVLGGRAE